MSATKILSAGSGVDSVRQKDLWFDSSAAQTGEENQVIVADSFFKDGMNARRCHSSLSSGGRGELLQSTIIYGEVVSVYIKISFQLLSHRG